MNAWSTDWPFLVVGWALMLGGVVFACRCLFHDRSRGRRRCAGCWYAMDGTPGLQCPECGRAANNENGLHRTRRRWGRACLAAAVVLVGTGISRVPDYNRAGWYGAIPSSVLVLIAPADFQTAGGLGGGWQQFGAVTVAPGATVVGRQALTPGMVAPAIRAKRRAPDMRQEVWDRLQSGRLAQWQSQIYLERYFKTAPLDLSIRVPDRWPAGSPIPVIAKEPIRGLQTRLRVRGGSDKDWGIVDSGVFTMGGVAGAEGLVPVEAQLCRGPLFSPQVLYKTTEQIAIDIAPNLDTLVDRVSGEDADRTVLSALRPRLGWDGAELVVQVDDRAPELGLEFLIGVTVTVLDGERVLGRGEARLEPSRPVWKKWIDVPIGWEPGGERRAIEAGRVRIRIEGDPVGTAKIYMEKPFSLVAVGWSGTFEVPADVPGRD